MVKILIVERDRDVRLVFAEILARVGHSVLLAGDFSSAMFALEADREIGIVTTCLILPDGDGCELARQAKEKIAGIKALLITGSDQEEVRRRASTSAFDGVVFKPPKQGELVEAVSSLARS